MPTTPEQGPEPGMLPVRAQLLPMSPRSEPRCSNAVRTVAASVFAMWATGAVRAAEMWLILDETASAWLAAASCDNLQRRRAAHPPALHSPRSVARRSSSRAASGAGTVAIQIWWTGKSLLPPLSLYFSLFGFLFLNFNCLGCLRYTLPPNLTANDEGKLNCAPRIIYEAPQGKMTYRFCVIYTHSPAQH